MTTNTAALLDRSIDRLNELLPTGEPLPRAPSTVLLGADAALDSMGFVNLLVAIEEQLEAAGISVMLADRVQAETSNPFTLSDLHALLERIISETARRT